MNFVSSPYTVGSMLFYKPGMHLQRIAVLLINTFNFGNVAEPNAAAALDRSWGAASTPPNGMTRSWRRQNADPLKSSRKTETARHSIG